ncbi:MAG: Sir2 family NAD-dependent protein deacetylase [Thermodesulfobacteriota bacterium]
MEDLIELAAGILQNAEKILVFTGAGLSTESGIPDFRSPGGIWDRYDPQDFYFQNIISDERAREKYWKMSSEYYAVMKNAHPNSAHLAVRELEDMGKLLAVVTQNIDSMHQRAGNSPGKVIEIHGTAFSVSCLRCGRRYGRDEIEERLRIGLKAPSCDSCKGILKPETISFGQAMPEDKMADALRYAQECDVCMVLGSSLVVYPAASVPLHAAEQGAKLVIINRDPTPLDSQAEVVIHASLGVTLTDIMERLRSKHR